MIKHYEERGGGYSQMEALKSAIKAIDFLQTLQKAEIPEKIEVPRCGNDSTVGEHEEGINKGIDLFTPIYLRKVAECEELRETIKTWEEEVNRISKWVNNHPEIKKLQASEKKLTIALKAAEEEIGRLKSPTQSIRGGLSYEG